MRSLHLFAGAGGGLLADLILGHTPIGAVEIDPYCCDVLRQRRDDGWFPGLRVHEQDIRLFDPSEYAGRVDLIAGGFPCQDISAAGKGAGITGERSGLWSEFARVIRLVRPRFVFVENSPMLTLRGLDVVLADLAALGFDAVWEVVSAAQAGAPHRRERIWILANARGGRCGKPDQGQDQQPGRTEAKCASALADSHSGDAQCGSGQRPGIRKPQAGQGPNDHAGGSSEVAYAASTGWPAGGPAIGDGPHGQICDVQSANGGCVVADPHRLWWEPQSGLGVLADELSPQLVPGWWDTEPDVGRVATGVKNRVGQLKALGNAQVPMQCALAWRMLSDAISR